MCGREFEFPWPNQDKGYQLFPNELESDPLVFFHGTHQRNLESICKNGFLSASELENDKTRLTSVSYATDSSHCLGHVCNNRPTDNQDVYVVFAVRFETINHQRIRINESDIHVDDKAIKPEIIGYCVIPSNYLHR